MAFSTNFCPIKSDMSGNTVWPQALGFQNFTKNYHFWYFLSIQNVNIARFARNVEWDFLCDFQTLWITSKAQWILDITYDLKRFEISKFLGHPVLKSFLHKINAFEERKLFVIGETMPLERLQLFPQNTLKKWRRGNKRFPSLFSIHIFNICPPIFLLLCLMIMKAVAELSFMVGRFH